MGLTPWRRLATVLPPAERVTGLWPTSWTSAGLVVWSLCPTAPVTELLAVVRRTCRTGHRGRLPLTRSEFKGMCAKNLSKASGHHRRLCLVISTLGCLRRKAAVSLRVSYTISGSICIYFSASSGVYIAYDRETQMEYIGLRVNVDKNVDSSIEAHAYIPAAVPALGVRPVDMLRDYLLRFRPTSGGYLLTAPRTQGLGSATFHPGLYTCLGRAYWYWYWYGPTAYLRAFPDASARSVDMSRVSAHSGRKSLSQWLWDANQSVRLIADVGHWRCAKDAVHLYFKSTPSTIRRCVAAL